jgi:hypothetical protein
MDRHQLTAAAEAGDDCSEADLDCMYRHLRNIEFLQVAVLQASTTTHIYILQLQSGLDLL